ncbi:MAG TPA: redox-regulated ATPase YchF [Deltaproteobacteria bacterium]|nr:redox-regulated ATPase YchF [Deltaproteobacteria bacterium]
MKIGIVGLKQSGKTTIFNALTRMEAATGEYSSARNDPNIAIVTVTDPRVARLSDLYHPKKTTYATLECMDFCGIHSTNGGERKEVFSTADHALMKSADALALVVRNFHDPIVSATRGEPDPLADLSGIVSELILSDMILVETRLERIEHQMNRGMKSLELDIERRALEKVSAFLDEGDLNTPPALTPEEQKAIRGLRLLSLKPLLVVLNSDEETFGRNSEIIANIMRTFPCVEFAGQFEMELARLEDSDAAAFMEDMGITASARNRLTMASYALLGCISFFTVGPDEVRAWTIHKGDSAVDAAAAIHSDIARGFIRAECFAYDDLVDHGSERALKDKGLIRLEGKSYRITDGDILTIRFNV